MNLTSPVNLNLQQELQDPKFRERYFDCLTTGEIAEQIREFRKLCGLTQAELAEKSGMHQSAVSRLEKEDYAGMTINTLLRIAGALNMKLRVEFVPAAEVLKSYEGR